MRKLARIETIEGVKPIGGADRIEAYNVGGWWVVDQKGAYQIGDKAIYVEVDAWVPHELAPFLSKGSVPREYEGVKGNRLKTVRLKGQLSQGLLLNPAKVLGGFDGLCEAGVDVSEYLGIIKWEAPVSASLGGVARGTFPAWARKTDQERIQNLKSDLQGWIESQELFEVTMKLDGSSMSVGFSPDREFVVCSRNLSLDLSQEGNTFVTTAKELDLENRLKSLLPLFPKGFMVQGELMGEGIQGNKENIKGHKFFVFDIYDVVSGSYLPPRTRRTLVRSLGLDHVPVLHGGDYVGTIGD